MGLCKHKNILGKPNEGLHSYRIMDIAIFDVLATIALSYFISKRFKKPFKYTLLCLFIIGIIAHKLFCVTTTLDKVIFP